MVASTSHDDLDDMAEIRAREERMTLERLVRASCCPHPREHLDILEHVHACAYKAKPPASMYLGATPEDPGQRFLFRHPSTQAPELGRGVG
jgi:hypothetical protein